MSICIFCPFFNWVVGTIVVIGLLFPFPHKFIFKKMPELFNTVLEVLTAAIGQLKKNKMYPNWKGRGKIVIIFKWHDTIQKIIKNPPKKLLELLNKFSKVEGNKIQFSSVQSLSRVQLFATP